ncbi:MAG: PH domain-containing protein [Candidatus Aenigmatarchaeota archaeon]
MGNYVLLTLVLILFFLVWIKFDITFSLFPRTVHEFQSTMVAFGFLVAITFLIEEPTIERMIRHYIVTNNEVIKVEGILRKKRISVPYQSVADVRVEKGIVGRIFNFGTVHVAGVGRGADITMKGMRDPDTVYRVIKNKIGLTRGAILKEGKKFQ